MTTSARCSAAQCGQLYESSPLSGERMKSTGITVRYQDHKSGSVKEKSFKSQATYEKWLEKADVNVLAYEESK